MSAARAINQDLYLYEDFSVRSAEQRLTDSGGDGAQLRLDRGLFPKISRESGPSPYSLLPVRQAS